MGYNPEEAGKRLAKFRKERGMSQEKFAAEFNVTRQYISLLERGLMSASLDLLWDIADKYDCSLDYLVLGKVNLSDKEAYKQSVQMAVMECLDKCL